MRHPITVWVGISAAALISCQQSSSAVFASDEEFARQLVKAIETNDRHFFSTLAHPRTNPDLSEFTDQLLGGMMKLKLRDLKFSLLPGGENPLNLKTRSHKGKKIRDLMQPDGVVVVEGIFLNSAAGQDPGRLRFTIPFVKAEGRYYTVPIDFVE